MKNKMIETLQKCLTEARGKSPEEIAAAFERVNNRFRMSKYEFEAQLTVNSVKNESYKENYLNNEGMSAVSVDEITVIAA